MKRGNFTLIELLVVIAILAVLLSMLAPGLNSARALGRRISCLCNMKSLGLSSAMYLNDHNNFWFYWKLPDGTHYWYSGDSQTPSFAMPSFNSGYLKVLWKSGDYFKGSILNCPAKGVGEGFLGGSLDYMYSGNLTEASNRGWYARNAIIKSPSKTTVFGETIRWSEGNLNSHFFYCWPGTYNWSPPDGGRTFQWTTHLGMDNFTFVDGHVSSHKQAQALDKNTFVWDTRQE